MLEKFIEYNPVKDNYKNQKFNILPNIKEFYKGRREVLIAFAKNSLNERFLERLGHTPLSEKENEILNKNFGDKNIDKLKDDLENAVAEKEYDKLFNNINDRVSILKKLVEAVSNNVEKKIIMW